ncbi:MAG: lipoyl synthase [Spirochaetales bacterium]|jgi:lipoic acid synthetase|nr:lipoyl synthase [Spirochaetales bacterium]
MSEARSFVRKPEWLKIKIRGGENLAGVKGLLSRYALNTVCKEANCPNRMECYGSRTAAFMILGTVCSRGCAFCNVSRGLPQPVDGGEAVRIAAAAGELGLRYVVITSVTRDDLPDGGAGQFARVIRELKTALPGIMVEVLIPDFQGDGEALGTVLGAGPDVLNHNVETVPRLYPAVRPQALYARSLELLRRAGESADGLSRGTDAADGKTGGEEIAGAKTSSAETSSVGISGVKTGSIQTGNIRTGSIKTKSGLMAGLGESPDEIREVIRDIRATGCDFLTIGQYLAPSARHYPVREYISPARFEEYKHYALSLGFAGVASGPFVRSSYRAAVLADTR